MQTVVVEMGDRFIDYPTMGYIVKVSATDLLYFEPRIANPSFGGSYTLDRNFVRQGDTLNKVDNTNLLYTRCGVYDMTHEQAKKLNAQQNNNELPVGREQVGSGYSQEAFDKTKAYLDAVTYEILPNDRLGRVSTELIYKATKEENERRQFNSKSFAISMSRCNSGG